MKHKINSITAKEDGYIAYVDIIDDVEGVTLTNLCVEFKNEKEFEAELNRKKLKFLSTTSKIADIKTKIESVLFKIEKDEVKK